MSSPPASNRDICEDCGAPVVRTKSAVWNPSGASKPLHRQTCTNPPPIKTQTVEQVRRQHRL